MNGYLNPFIIYQRTNISNNYYLLSINRDTFNIEFGHFTIGKQKVDTNKKRLSIDSKTFISSFSTDDLFSCHSKIKNEKQVKGIFYESVRRIFYIFVKRYYLIVDYDIVRNEFKINDSVYSKNLFDLKFINEEYLEKTAFENLETKWVKAGDFFYPRLIPYDETFFVYSHYHKFTIYLKSYEDLKNQYKKWVNCTGHIEYISEKYFCFTELTYRLLDESDEFESINNIHEIFDEYHDGLFDKDDRILFIFKYEDENQEEYKKVFMTHKKLFIFSSHKFHINSDLKIYYKDVTKDSIIIYRNCLFDQCLEANKSSNVYLSCVFVIIILIVVISALYCIKNKKSLKKEQKIIK